MSKTIDVDTRTFVRFWVVILGLGLLGLFIWKAMPGLLIVLTSIFLAVALHPLAKKIDSIDKKKERRNLSSIMAVIVVVVSILAIIGLVGPVIVNETSKFLGSVPEQANTLLQNGEIDRFGASIGIPDLKQQIITGVKDASQNFISNLSGFTINSISAIGNVFTAAILIVVLTILFMLQGPEVMDKLWGSLASRDKAASKAWRRVIDRCAEVVAKYVSGQLIVAILDGTIVAISVLVLSILFGLNANLAIPMGLIAAFFYLIPMFGPIITAILVTLLLLPNSVWAALAFLVFYIIYAQIENNLVSPKIQGKGLNLPPLLILVAVTIGIYTFGLIGCVVAIPVAGCIKVFIEEYPNLKGSDKEE
jgi:predicted PurR-regulated permease PerM